MFNTTKQGKLAPITDQLLLTPAHKLSMMVKEGSLSSVKLCELFAGRIKEVNTHINAMAQDRFEEALSEARRIDEMLASFRGGKSESEFSAAQLEQLRSPLLGVPISIKESIMVKGMRNSCGLWARRNSLAQEDAVVVGNVQRFGMVPICTTNIPEGTLYWADCQNLVYGRSVNPYDLSRITGASSGGEGSLIGSAGSLIGIGSDIGGSLRIPAHYCGIFSHKPSPFLASSEGNFPVVKEARLRLFTLGPMCRYASDLRPLLKCILSDCDNAKQDTYYKFQPENIGQLRRSVVEKLDETIDLSQLKFYYFDFNNASELKGKHALHVQTELMEAQQEILDHFRSKYNATVEALNPDKYLRRVFITWKCMMLCGGTVDRETSYDDTELANMFGIHNLAMEFIKMPLGLSKHTKEALLAMAISSTGPRDKKQAFELCEKFEKYATEIKDDIESKLGENGVLIMPTLPTVAYKHNASLFKTEDIRFPSLFNVLQLPVTHATVRLDKKHRLPFGISIAAKQYNDPTTLAVAEEIELAFGGWTPPSQLSDSIKAANHAKTGDDSLMAASVGTSGVKPTRDNHAPLADAATVVTA